MSLRERIKTLVFAGHVCDGMLWWETIEKAIEAAISEPARIHITELADWLSARYRAAGGKENVTDLSAWSEEVMRWTESRYEARISSLEAEKVELQRQIEDERNKFSDLMNTWAGRADAEHDQLRQQLAAANERLGVLGAECDALRNLLRRASIQIMQWAAKYGENSPEWLPPAGDVRLLEDIDAALAAQAGERKAGA